MVGIESLGFSGSGHGDDFKETVQPRKPNGFADAGRSRYKSQVMIPSGYH